MSFYTEAAAPPTLLGRYRALSKHTSLQVSPLQLGGQSIGDQWHAIGMGIMDKDSSFKLMDAYFNAGGNIIDTANNYQNGSSERFIGEWMEQRGNRDQMIIATKYSFNFKLASADIVHKVNFHGNNAKSLMLSVEESLRNLGTSYIDILYVHVWDFQTSVEEVMNNLHNLIIAGKVLYLGISDSPAWVVSQANQYARDHGKTPFSIYQGSWNIMDRAFERDIIPMAREHGMALAPWNVLAGGKLRSNAEETDREKSGEFGRDLKLDDNGWKRTEQERKVTDALEKVGKEVGVESTTAVAIAYLLNKTPYVFPVIGGRKVEHLMQNINALKIALTPAQMEYLESIIPFKAEFPHTITGDGSRPSGMFAMVAQTDRVPFASPIQPKTS